MLINLKRAGEVYDLDQEDSAVFGQKKLNTSHWIKSVESEGIWHFSSGPVKGGRVLSLSYEKVFGLHDGTRSICILWLRREKRW